MILIVHRECYYPSAGPYFPSLWMDNNTDHCTLQVTETVNFLGPCTYTCIDSMAIVNVIVPQSNGNGQTSTPHRIKTPQPITLKLCTIDYVHETNK